MKLDPRGKAKLARVLRYGGVALITAWLPGTLVIFAAMAVIRRLAA